MTAQGLTTPLILCLACWEQGQAVEAVREGAWDCLRLPVSETDLLAAVFPALQYARARQSAKDITPPPTPATPPGGEQGGSSPPRRFGEEGSGWGCPPARLREELLWEVVRNAQKLETAGQLAGRVVHDLNNMLMIVQGNCDIMKMSLPPTSPWLDSLSEIGQAAASCASLARELLTLSRKDTNQAQPIDLNAVLTRMGLLLRHLLGKPIKTVCKLEPLLGLIRADPGQIDQLILNLVCNARDAMTGAWGPVGGADSPPQTAGAGGKLLLETANLELASPSSNPSVPPGSYVLLKVSDTGCGMTEETRARLFEPFYTTKPAGRGTGLGLATVREILRHLGGNVKVESEVGIGSTFTLYFPRLGSSARPAELIGTKQPSQTGTKTILVVEDDEGVRNFVRRVLEKEGYRVLLASLPVEAWKLCEQTSQPIHLLITNLLLPQIDGMQLAHQVASLHPDVPVLFLTAYLGHALVQRVEEQPRARLLAKPFAPKALLAEVEQMLAG